MGKPRPTNQANRVASRVEPDRQSQLRGLSGPG